MDKERNGQIPYPKVRLLMKGALHQMTAKHTERHLQVQRFNEMSHSEHVIQIIMTISSTRDKGEIVKDLI